MNPDELLADLQRAMAERSRALPIEQAIAKWIHSLLPADLNYIDALALKHAGDASLPSDERIAVLAITHAVRATRRGAPLHAIESLLSGWAPFDSKN